MSQDRAKIEGDLGALLTDHLVSKLGYGDYGGVKWSPNMPDDDPLSPIIVVDESGTEHVIEVDVMAYPYRDGGPWVGLTVTDRTSPPGAPD